MLRALARLDREGLAWIDVRPEVRPSTTEAIQDDLDRSRCGRQSCNNYYRGPSGRIVTQWPHNMAEYATRTSRLDDDAYEVSGIAT